LKSVDIDGAKVARVEASRMMRGEKDLACGQDAAGSVDGEISPFRVARKNAAEGFPVDEEDPRPRANVVARHRRDGLNEKTPVRQVAPLMDERAYGGRDPQRDESPFRDAYAWRAHVDSERQTRRSIPDEMRRHRARQPRRDGADAQKREDRPRWAHAPSAAPTSPVTRFPPAWRLDDRNGRSLGPIDASSVRHHDLPLCAPTSDCAVRRLISSRAKARSRAASARPPTSTLTRT